MNVNELADELEKASTRAEDHGTIAKRNTLAATMLRQQQALINQRDDEIKALYNLVTEQDKKIIDLAFKLAYAERGNEVVKEAKYGITTKWDGITTYHETTEPIGKVKELTDEEIMSEIDNVYERTDDIEESDLIDFARAILRKAQEK